MLLGVVADDLTGATDVALMLQRAGMRVVQVIGVPRSAAALPEAQAVVVSLKSRTSPAGEAVAQSLASARALRERGAQQILFKYCSTFDSTDAGNIGPVADALFDALGATSAVFCPAFPANARTIYQGHLFVGGRLLSESSMRDHPLTPMRDANLVRVLGRQTKRGVGLVPLPMIEAGPQAIAAAIAKEAAEERPFVVADALVDKHLLSLGKALAGAPLVTGGSGIAMGLPANFGIKPAEGRPAPMADVPRGRRLVLSGSCSEATRRQVEYAIAADMPALQLEPQRLADGSQDASAAVRWLAEQSPDSAALIYATAAPAAVRKAQEALGPTKAGALVEEAMAEIAAIAVKRGTTRLIVAGGETSGAVVQALGVRALAIGPEIDPGAPWTRVVDGPAIALALKSGNFGQDDFFTRAWSLLA
jgi:3-dehydrotetronate 4-kinase